MGPVAVRGSGASAVLWSAVVLCLRTPPLSAAARRGPQTTTVDEADAKHSAHQSIIRFTRRAGKTALGYRPAPSAIIKTGARAISTTNSDDQNLRSVLDVPDAFFDGGAEDIEELDDLRNKLRATLADRT